MVEKLAKSLKGRTLILVERVIHGDILNRLIPNSLWVYGKDTTETRERVIEQLQKAKDNVVAIATQGIFSVGINFFVHNMINAAGGKAEHDIIQRMGRGLRTAADKEILNYYDFIFEINPYLDDHSHQRIKVLKREKHEVIIKDDVDF
jgi:superfamily II DNA or RNA helicase